MSRDERVAPRANITASDVMEGGTARSEAGPDRGNVARPRRVSQCTTHRGPLIPPSLRILQKWIAMRNPVASGSATTWST
jgi:hypothetical protein